MPKDTDVAQPRSEDPPVEPFNELLDEVEEDSGQEPEIDLEALANEVYALMLKDLKLELQRFGRTGGL